MIIIKATSLVGLTALAFCSTASAAPTISGVSVFLENAGNHRGSPGTLISANATHTLPATSVFSVTSERIVTDGSGPWIQPLTYQGGTFWREWQYNFGPPSSTDALHFAVRAIDNLGLHSAVADVIIPAGYDLDEITNLSVTPQVGGYRVALDGIVGAESYTYWVWGVPGYPTGYAYSAGSSSTVAGLPLLPYDLLNDGQSFSVTVFAYRTFSYSVDGNAAFGTYRRYISIDAIAVPSGACCEGGVCRISGASGCIGDFRGDGTMCGTPDNPIACCPANFNAVDGLSVQDIFDFLAAHFTASQAADFNHSGVVSVQDIFDFLAAYFAGCP